MPLSAVAAAPFRDRWLRVSGSWLRLAMVLALLPTALYVPTVLSQVRPGASLTVVRGSVSVTQSDGTKVYPAGTGLTLAIGDIVGTLERTQAIVTFFSGSEIELGSNTTIVIRRLDRDLLDQANVTVEHLSGATLIRVPTDTGPNPGMRVLANDTVAVIRAGEVGHGVDPTSNNVTVACVDGEWHCSRDATTFPNATTFLLGQTALVVTGAGDLIALRVLRGSSIWDVLAEGGALDQKDGTSRSTASQDDEKKDREKEEDDNKPNQPLAQAAAPTSTPTPTRTPTPSATPTVTSTPTLTPTVAPPPGSPGPACGVPRPATGTTGVITTVHNLGRPNGNVRIDWDALLEEDQFEIFYQGQLIFSSGFVTGTGSATRPYSGTSPFVTVVVTTSTTSFIWRYTVFCLP